MSKKGMTKKELLKHVNQYDLNPREFYHSSQFGRTGEYFVVTDENGKAIDITSDREKWKEENKIRELDKAAAKDIKKQDDTERKIKVKGKRELDELKKDPTVLQEKLDNKYIEYQEAAAKLEEWKSEASVSGILELSEKDGYEIISKTKPEHAQGRKLNRQKIIALRNVYDTAKTYNTLKKEDDPTDYYGEVIKAITGSDVAGGPKQKMDTGLARQEAMAKTFDPNKPFSKRPEIPKILKEQYETLSDDELLERLKLGQK